jgi:hypothetical protein
VGGAQPLAEVPADPGRQGGQQLAGLGLRGQRQQGSGADVVQRPDQGGHPLALAGVGQRLGDLRDPSVRGDPRAGVAHPDDDRDQLPAGDRNAQRPGPGGRFAGIGVGAVDDGADQRAVSLPLQALLLPGEQPPERQRAGRPLDQHGVWARRRAVTGQDDPSPVLAARADRGHQPAGALVVERAPRPGHGPGPVLEPGQQRAGVGRPGRAGQHPVREILQDHRPAREQRRLPDDLVGRRPGHRQFGERLVDPFRRAQLGQLGVDDPRVHRLGDLDERHLAVEHDQRDAVPSGRLGQRVRQPAVPAAQLHGQAADPGRRQVGHVVCEQPGVFGQGDAGAQDQLAAVQQPGHVGQLDGVHPADPGAEPVVRREHLGAPAPDGLQIENLGQGGQHARPRYRVSDPCRIPLQYVLCLTLR